MRSTAAPAYNALKGIQLTGVMLTMLLLTIEDLEKADRLTLLYREYNALLYHEALSLLHSHDDAEDAVADAFEALLKRRSLPALGEPRVKALLITIVKRKAAVIYNKRLLEQAHLSGRSVEESAAEIIPDSALPSDVTLALQEAIAGLPEAERDALILFAYHGYTTSEIAEMKGVKQDTVQKRIKRARARLKQLLDE